jgi:hypothetical protein
VTVRRATTIACVAIFAFHICLSVSLYTVTERARMATKAPAAQIEGERDERGDERAEGSGEDLLKELLQMSTL